MLVGMFFCFQVSFVAAFTLGGWCLTSQGLSRCCWVVLVVVHDQGAVARDGKLLVRLVHVWAWSVVGGFVAVQFG